MRTPVVARFARVVVGLALTGTTAVAQSASVQGTCSYAQCALGIVPAWNGLLVTQGASHTRLANLGFFWTGSLDHVFAPNDSALAYGRRAVRVRRTAALLTDVGALALGYAAVRGLSNGRLNGGDRAVAIVGGATFAVSVPLQFSADGLLSRAVWWRNSRFAVP
jgi:hypothetical protein